MAAETNASYRDAALAHWRAGRLAQAVDGLRHATRAGEPGAAPALLQAAADPEAPAQARADAVEALASMHRTGAGRLMVVEGGRLLGIIALKDLLNFLSMKIELEQA